MVPRLKSILVPVLLAGTALIVFSLLRVPTPEATREDTVRGITISTRTDGRDWASPALVGTLEDIRAVGADWVCIHPYGWIDPAGGVRFHELDPDHPPAYLVRPSEEAHALGLKILIKPHIGYWGSPFSYRGEIRFEDPVAWDRFFRDYERWIVQLARACRGADAFVVGTELDATVSHETEWRRIIAAVREVCPAPLTYGANWDAYRSVGFWDALDVIGIQAYFPIVRGTEVDSVSLASGWQGIMAELCDYARSVNRKVAFTELGYNRSFSAPVEPWSYRVDGPEAETIQALCLKVALQAIEQEPEVVAVFLWKWFPGPDPVGRNFQLATPGLRSTIASVWKGDGSRG